MTKNRTKHFPRCNVFILWVRVIFFFVLYLLRVWGDEKRNNCDWSSVFLFSWSKINSSSEQTEAHRRSVSFERAFFFVCNGYRLTFPSERHSSPMKIYCSHCRLDGWYFSSVNFVVNLCTFWKKKDLCFPLYLLIPQYMTDGMLLREFLSEPDLAGYR